MPVQRTATQFQLEIPSLSRIDDAITVLADAGNAERGAIFTRREVVEFILDLVGYQPDAELHRRRLLEPSFGEGDFLLPALDRLFAAVRKFEGGGSPVLLLRDAIRGVELHKATYRSTVARVLDFLRDQGLNVAEAQALASAWLHNSDFLLSEFSDGFSHVIGNPPYVRQELVPNELMSEYRRRYDTIYDRADLYIPFIEHGLRLLIPTGQLGFICADRWIKNRYGKPLRQLVASEFRLRIFVDMVDTPAFLTEVSAYPAIFVIGKEAPGPTRIARQPAIDSEGLSALATDLKAEGKIARGVVEAPQVTAGSEPWHLEGLDQLAVVRRLEAEFPTLENAGCKVGIGVATGADQIFVAPYDALDVEADRKLPLVMSRDIVSGEVNWRGQGVLNPFLPDGRLAPLEDYPRFARYIEQHGSLIRTRHVSQKNPKSWYRTIDRIYPDLMEKPKLLVPDIKGSANIVYEEGKFYPHHNLYFITSEKWDLRVLQAVLMSGIARLFVSTYSTKMRGGYLRFQAQYLRRIRIPHWGSVSTELQRLLADAAARRDRVACDEAVAQLYGLSAAERALILKEPSSSDVT